MRSINVIASDISKAWKNINYGAKPYLEAMHHLNTVNDYYYADNAREIILRFLCNASTFRGPEAKKLKLELKELLK